MRYMKKYPNSGSVQTALDQEELGKPYMAFLEDEHRIDWNSLSPVPSENWVDIRTIDNTTPIYNVAWKNGGFSSINDTWFSEASGIVADNYVDDAQGWRQGTTEELGYWKWHRFSSRYAGFTCTFIPEGRQDNGVNLGYGISRADATISSLPAKVINGETYYELGIVNWKNWKPLYMPLSTSKIQSTYLEGGIMVDIAPKS